MKKTVRVQLGLHDEYFAAINYLTAATKVIDLMQDRISSQQDAHNNGIKEAYTTARYDLSRIEYQLEKVMTNLEYFCSIYGCS